MKKFIISRTDSIGDVILTLPMAGVLKKYFPDCHISFLGKEYTRPVIEACEHVDEFLEFAVGSRQSAVNIEILKEISADVILHVFPVKEICKAAKKAGIPIRIATSHRWFTWLLCNKLVHFSRKNSDLHEAQLNLRLLEPLGITQKFSTTEIPDFYGLAAPPPTPPLQGRGERGGAFNLILHPKSRGSGREWDLDNYSRLIRLLPEEKFRIFITGTKEESLLMEDFLQQHKNRVINMTGKLNLTELLGLINNCDGLVSSSTGPLHIAAALGKYAIGLFPPIKPMHPGRWAPLGVKADYLVLDKECNDCRHSMDCECIRSIKPEDVIMKIEATYS